MADEALTLCSSQGKREYESQLKDEMNRANKKLWYLRLDREIARKKALRSYLIVPDWEMQSIVEGDKTLSEELKDRYNEQIIQLLNRNIPTEKAKVPPELVCFLTKQLMKDPVCNQHGNTYCRKAYLDYTKHKPADPRTQYHSNQLRKQLVSKVIYPNLNIRKAIEDFLAANLWAYEQTLG